MLIAPSILSANFAYFARDIKIVEDAGADALHVDIMDGHFVPNLTFGAGVVEAIRPVTNLPLDVHLMITAPERWVESYVNAGADTLLVHQESTAHLYSTLQQIQQLGAKAGVVINPGTPVSAIEPVLPLVDQVLVMTVNPGFGGQKFLPAMSEKVALLAELRQANDWHYVIEVDGGIKDDTIASPLEAGADLFVAGSFIYEGEDPAVQIAKLRAAAQ